MTTLEPNLKPVFDAGVIYESAMHARDPHGILKEIFTNAFCLLYDLFISFNTFSMICKRGSIKS